LARPTKDGLDYFPLDVDFLSDFKVKILRGRYGSDGVLLYIYLLCEIYKKGYYLKLDSDALYCIVADLNMSEDKTRQILNFLLERSLFNDKLFRSDKVLTAASIQRRYQEACKNRRRDIEVAERFWVLSEDETLSFIKVRPENDKPRINSGKYGKSPDKSEVNSTNKIKEKERKLDEKIYSSQQENTVVIPSAYSSYTSCEKLITALTDYEQMITDSLKKPPFNDKTRGFILEELDSLSKNDDEKIRILYQSVKKRWNGIFPLQNSRRQSEGRPEKTHSYNLDEFYQAALNSTPNFKE
jgi:hypothetical protein